MAGMTFKKMVNILIMGNRVPDINILIRLPELLHGVLQKISSISLTRTT
ncbi:MAG: hypothetical protein Q7U54_18400 [Bacteroidales bacterium]|nr:hypothetical protein [Bacteroidales bacterium]